MTSRTEERISRKDARAQRRWKRYPKYKDSGVEWLGEIPEHWDLPPLYARYTVDLGKMLDSKRIAGDCLLPYLRNVDVQWDSISVVDLPEMDITPEERARYTLSKGDLVVCEGGEVGRTAIWDERIPECAFQKALHRLRPRGTRDLPRFFYYVMRVAASSGVFLAHSNPNTIAHLTAEKLRVYRFGFPPFDEQRAIAAFLDRETGRIDALIEKKQRQIALLQEKRQALISHAVTKGLDPTVKLKPSGIEWLGEIPKHWDLTRLKFLSTLQTGLTLGKKYGDSQLVRRPYLRVANVQDGYLDLSNITEVEIPSEEAARHQLRLGDVLMTEGGDFDKLGRGYVWEDQIPNCLHQNHIFAVRPDPIKLDPHYLAGVLTSLHGKNYFTSTSQQTTNLATTNSTKLLSFPLPVPPVREQRLLVRRLAETSGTLARLADRILLTIEGLREYRTALISAAVTGKVQVRP